ETTLFAEMLTENYHTASIKTIALVNRHNAYVIETQKAVQSDIFKAWAEDASQNKCVFDAKAVRVAFLHEGIDLQGIDFDMMLAAYLINPADKNDEIAPIARRNGFSSIKYNEEVYGKGKKLAVPEEAAAFYSHVIRKTNAMHELQGTFKELLDENNMNNLFTELELPLASILAEMEYQGVKVDIDRLKQMGEDLTARLDTMERNIHELAGETFNINSPKQLAVILFENL